jgi:hypothetical protein
MKTSVLIIVIMISSASAREIWPRVCLWDGNTPLELADPCVPWVYRDIMAGTHLTIIINSDDGGLWDWGELYIEPAYQPFGILAARDYNETTDDWSGSRFPAAGNLARVWDFEESYGKGFWFRGDHAAIAGDWFIIDYNAIDTGESQVAFINWDISDIDPACVMKFTQVPTRDFDNSHIVDFRDFAVLGAYWGVIDCADPNGCGKVDFDGDGKIYYEDLWKFTEYWLERTDSL